MLPQSAKTDVQGIILYAYGHMEAASYLMLRIQDVALAKGWLKEISEKLTYAGGKKSEKCINLAFTKAGLVKLGLPDKVMQTFPRPFNEGMTMEHKAKGFGDLGENAPDQWDWGYEPKGKEIHMVLMIYGENQTILDEYQARQIAKLDLSGVQVIQQLDTEPVMHNTRKEHFGFTDGIGQPAIEGISKPSFADNTIKLGEFLLGYKNEYNKYPNAPFAPTDMDKMNLLEPMPDHPDIRDLGKNGSFLVFRQMQQDVNAFWQYMHELAEERKKVDNTENMVSIASKMVGRWPNGTPLAISPKEETTVDKPNDFGYHDKDLKGFGCPISSHLRRANPRDAFTEDPEKAIKFVKKNRILRRGRGYGKPLDPDFNPDTMLNTPAEGQRGLHFLAFNSHLARQFELVQKQWLCNPKFLGLYEDVDPVVGHHTEFEGAKFNTFTEPAKPVRKKAKLIPRFVEIKGGAYFFMPGIKAVKFLASL